jgi:DNA adenine methylase
MNVAHDAPRTPVLRYPGAKNQLARWIISYMPAHESYTEAYCGSCAVLLNKRRARLEAVNDRSSEIVNFFSVLRSRPDELINQIWLTPWSAEEYTLAFAEASDDVERARRFYFRCWSSIRPFDDNPSFRRQPKLSRGKNGDRPPMVQAAKEFMRTDHLWYVADRMRGVTIENMDALDFLERYDYAEVLHYVDPPYPFSTRTQLKHYEYEMSEDDHRALAAVLHSLEGMVLLSGYDCPLYDELYPDWRRLDRTARIDGGGSAVESLWLSPRVVERLHHADLPLFAGNGHQEAR